MNLVEIHSDLSCEDLIRGKDNSKLEVYDGFVVRQYIFGNLKIHLFSAIGTRPPARDYSNSRG